MQRFITVPIDPEEDSKPSVVPSSPNIEESIIVPTPVSTSLPRYAPSRGALHESLAQKIRGIDEVSKNETTYEPEIQEKPSSQLEFVSPSIEKFPEWFDTQETKDETIQTPSITQVPNPSSTEKLLKEISMNVSPAVISIVLFLTVGAFIVGRLTASPSKQVSAQMLPGQGSTAPLANMAQTPTQILSSANAIFQSTVELSKKTDQTDTDKAQISANIHQVLAILSDGITQYPDVAALYFQRAQVEKVVAKSSDQLKKQADQDYLKSMELNPQLADYPTGYADFLIMFGDFSQAASYAKKAVEMDGKNTNGLFVLAQAQESMHDTTSALATYDQLLSLIPATSPDYSVILSHKQKLQPPTTPIPVQTSSSSAALSGP